MQFPQLLGNERLKEQFARADLSKIGSAIIFDGPSGCGKLTAAVDLASAILCRGENKPCGVCPSCVRIKAGTNSDFEIFEKTDKTRIVTQIRELRSRSFVTSGDSGTKVFIIPYLDKLSPQSQNALLKVLEEPASSVFIITCESYLFLLQTVRSRCKVYHLDALSDDIIRNELQKCGKYKSDEIEHVIPLCEGRLGYAFELLEKGENPAENAVRQMLKALGNELETYKAAGILAGLSKDDYLLFCRRFCDALMAEIKTGKEPEKLVKIIDHINSQTKLFTQNPSVTALSGALAAFCGELYGG